MDTNKRATPATNAYTSQGATQHRDTAKKYLNIVFSNFVVIIMLRIHTIKHEILWLRKEYIIIL